MLARLTINNHPPACLRPSSGNHSSPGCVSVNWQLTASRNKKTGAHGLAYRFFIQTHLANKLLGAFCMRAGNNSRPACSRQVLAYKTRHFKHGDLLFAEHFGQFVIGIDVALVLGILQVVGLDVVPQFLDHFSARQRAGA